MKNGKKILASLLLVTTLITSIPLEVIANQGEGVISTELQEIV